MNHKTLIVCYSLTGVSSKIAQALQKKTQADLYEIKTKRTYDADMWKAWDEAQAETAAGKLPGLVGDLPDLSGYDTVLLGDPVWGWTISNPLLAYIRQTDFAGKIVPAFWTFYDHDEKYAHAIELECKGAVVREGLSLTNSAIHSDANVSKLLDAWIQKIGI